MHPNKRRPIIRIATGLLIAIAALIPVALSTSAQENGLASITIYSSLCPPNYQEENFYDDCYDTPAGEGIVFTLTNLEDPTDTYSGTSGPSGFAAIEGIDHDGFFQLTFDVPFAISSAPGNCSEDGNPFEVGSQYQMNLTTDNDIRCDIFISPAEDQNPDPPAGDGSVTIYLTSCEIGYGGTDYYEDCYGNPVQGVTFVGASNGEEGSAVTNANGSATLELVAGSWSIASDIPGHGVDRIFIYCSLGGQRYEVSIDGFSAGIDVPADADIRCDWYIVPSDLRAADSGSLTIYNTACPAGYTGTDYYRDCFNNPQSGITFAASAIKLNFETSGVTGGNGIVTLPLPEDNTIGSPISLIQSPTIEVPQGSSEPPFFLYCSVDGERIDVDYNLVQRDPAPTDIFTASISPEPGSDVRCDWYDLVPAENDGGSLTIYNTSCPPGYSGSSYYPDCYNNPQSGITFAATAFKLNFQTSAVTGAAGIVTMPLPEDNTIDSPITLSQSPTIEVPKGSSEPPFFLYCSVNGERIDVHYLLVQRDPATTDIFVASISAEPGADVRCDWYDLPKGQSPSPAPSPAPSIPPVTQLPNTGTGDIPTSTSDDLMTAIALLGATGAVAAYILSRRSGRNAA